MPLAPGPATTTARGIVKLLGDFDASSTADAPIIGSLGGASPFAITPATLQWLEATASPTIKQAARTSDLATTSINLTPQAPYPSTANAARGTPGNVIVNLTAPVAGGNEAGLYVKRGSSGVAFVGALTANPSFYGMWFGPAAAAPATTNYSFLGDGNSVNFNYNGAAGGQIQFLSGGSGASGDGTVLIKTTGTQLFSYIASFGGGYGVLGITCAYMNATTNPSNGVVLWCENTTGHLKVRGRFGAVTTLAPAGSPGTINSQAQILDVQVGTCETVSSATATSIFTYTTLSDKSGFLKITLTSRATTTGTGIAVGEATQSVYWLGYKNVGGTVTLSTSGITLVGAAQTTAAALTSTLTASASGAVITLSVTNPALCTVDSQVTVRLAVC